MRDERLPAPFLKWAGGKRQIVERILRIAPRSIETYYEPFVGGGAVFFALAREPEVRFKQAVLADANEDLVRCYQAVKDDVEGVIQELSAYRYDRDCYYELRQRDPEQMHPIQRAARLIYLNRCGYNGLYRVNSRGVFNVPFGRYKHVVVCDPDRLRAASKALRKATIICADFAKAVTKPKKTDFVYLDPPYVPLSATASFTAYARDGFEHHDQQRLANLLRSMGERGIPALLSNSYCAVTRELYQDLEIKRIAVRRAINSVATARGAVPEILVRSFAFGGAGKEQKAGSVARSRPLPPGDPGSSPPQRRPARSRPAP